MLTARIVIIGNEVLSGEVEDRNIHYLARRLSGLGTKVASILVVPDEDDAITEGIRGGLSLYDRILLTGGIGPTHDDRTRESVAQSLSIPLAVHAEAEQRLRKGYGPGITPAELKMALLPHGARVLPGQKTGVFGFAVDKIYVFPGVPDLLVDIFEAVAPEFSGRPDHRVELMTRLREGDFADGLTAIQARHPGVAIGSYPVRDENGWFVRLIFKGADPAAVEAAAEETRALTGRNR